jgi:hypothetical protein
LLLVAPEFDELRVNKTKAHATRSDVERGSTTEWERRANNHADELAKRGASLRGLTAEHQLEYRSLANMAFQAARWAAESATILRRAPGSDASLLPAALKRSAKPAAPSRARSSAAHPQSLQDCIAQAVQSQGSGNGPASFNGHPLRMAIAGPGHIIFCASCAAYAWTAVCGLFGLCRGRVRTLGRAAQRARLANGRFPVRTLDWPLGPASPPPPAAVQCLQEAQSRQANERRHQPAAGQGPDETGPAQLERAELLGRYGLSEESFAAVVAKTRRLEQARRQAEPEDSEWLRWSAGLGEHETEACSDSESEARVGTGAFSKTRTP